MRNISRNNPIRFLLCVILLVLFMSYPGSATAAPDVSANKEDSLLTDNDGDGRTDPGDSLRYTITITNSGGEAATGIDFSDTIDNNTTFVNGSIKVTPIAMDDAYETIGNTQFTINAPEGILANDMDPDGTEPIVDSLRVEGIDTAGTQGDVTVNEDGSFTYTPPAGQTGITDSFFYIVRDPDGLQSNEPGMVSIQIEDQVWYVDNSAASGGDGRSYSPFSTLLQAQSASAPGDHIFVFEGDPNATGMDQGILLKENQRLIGQGVDLVVNGKTLQTATNPPILTNTAGNVITLAGSNEVRGIVLDGGSGHGIFGDGLSGGVIVAHTDITNNAGDGIHMANITDITIDLNDLTIQDNSGHGVSLIEITDTLILKNSDITGNGGSGLYLDNSTGNGNLDIDMSGIVCSENGGPEIQVKGGAPEINYTGDITKNSGDLVNISDTIGGTLNFHFNNVTGTGGSGIRISNVNSTVNVHGATLSGSSGIDIQGGNGTYTFTSADITGVSGTAFSLSNSTAIVTYNGNIANNSGDLILIDNLGAGGAVAFQSGTVIADAGSTGIQILNSAGAVSFSAYAAGSASDPLTSDAVNLSGNTGTVNFADISLYTSGAQGIFANGGNLNISNGAVDSTNGPAIDISETALGITLAGVWVENNNGKGINLINNTGTAHFDSLTASTTNGAGIVAINTGTVNVINGSLEGSAGAAADIDNTLINMNLTTISSTNSPTQGIDLTNLADGSVLNVSGNTLVSDASDKGIRIDTAGPGTDIDFGEVEIAQRNEIGLLIKDAHGNVDYGATTIPNPKNAGGYGIRVENSSADVTFESVDISDTVTTVAQAESLGIPINEGNGDGIFLINNTGSFNLNGGTIRDSDGDGIDIRNSANIFLDGVTITNTGNDGIQAIDMTGTNTVSACTITRFTGHGNANGMTIYGTNAGTMSLTVSSSLFSNEDWDGGNAGIFLEARSDYQATLVVDDAGGAVNDSIFEKITGSAIVTAAIDSSNVTTRIRDSIFRNAHGVLGNNAIDITAGGNATVGFIVEGNKIENLMRVSTFAGAVGFGSTSSRKMTGKIRNNDLDDTKGSGFASIISGSSNPSLDVTINNNHADNVARYGLRVRLDDTASGTVRAAGNRLGTLNPVGNDSSTRDGIEIRSRNNTGDYYVSLKSNEVVTDGSIGKAIDIDSEDNASIYLAVTEGNFFQNIGSGPDFDAETEDPGSEICLKLTGHNSRTFDLAETAGNFMVENLSIIETLNPGATINKGPGIDNSTGCPSHPDEPADP
ncbi:MAG: right-handed parallel beta-helix repeat-containing protein [bacterium]